jgi:hypothetical protein
MDTVFHILGFGVVAVVIVAGVFGVIDLLALLAWLVGAVSVTFAKRAGEFLGQCRRTTRRVRLALRLFARAAGTK